jgi:hypothetical protein
VVDAGLIYCIRSDDVSEILNSGKVQIGMIMLAPIGKLENYANLVEGRNRECHTHGRRSYRCCR